MLSNAVHGVAGKVKRGKRNESVTRLKLFKITLKFCKRWLFTVHLLPAVAHLALRSGWVFCKSFPGLCPVFPVWQAHVWTHIQFSINWPHFPLFLIFVVLVSSGVVEGQLYAASLVITGSWHGASTELSLAGEVELWQLCTKGERKAFVHLPELQGWKSQQGRGCAAPTQFTRAGASASPCQHFRRNQQLQQIYLTNALLWLTFLQWGQKREPSFSHCND